MKIPSKIRKWRRRQKKGAIMKPSTFEEIKRSAAAGGATNPAKVAGAAYWGRVRKMYRNRRKRVA